MSDPLLLVEDTPSLALVYRKLLEKAGYEVAVATSFAEAQAQFASAPANIVLLDLLLPDGDGADLMREMISVRPETKVVVITANGSINRAVEAMRDGAFDFLVKPFDDGRFLNAVRNAEMAGGHLDVPKKSGPDGTEFHGFLGSSPPMQEIYDMVGSIGRSTATVFITGESGTGKEVCAQAIHRVSNRASKPFVPLNCGAIPGDLLESEVFGHLKGSFTGAIADKKGAAEAADGGTLFLDEICEMDISLQTKLLRFIQSSMIQPVGATAARFVDVRIVCATNRDPREEVRAGRFREDLFYRLHVVPIHLPRLADRGADVNQIAEKMLLRFAEEEGKSFTGLSPQVSEIFRTYPWPGNVRQLLNALRNVVVLNDGPLVEAHMLPLELTMDLASGSVEPALVQAASAPVPMSINSLVGRTLADVERELIEATIAHCDGSISKAAHYLDVSASTIYRKREAWSKAAAKA